MSRPSARAKCVEIGFPIVEDSTEHFPTISRKKIMQSRICNLGNNTHYGQEPELGFSQTLVLTGPFLDLLKDISKFL